MSSKSSLTEKTDFRQKDSNGLFENHRNPLLAPERLTVFRQAQSINADCLFQRIHLTQVNISLSPENSLVPFSFMRHVLLCVALLRSVRWMW